jgi:hypothetical protein
MSKLWKALIHIPTIHPHKFTRPFSGLQLMQECLFMKSLSYFDQIECFVWCIKNSLFNRIWTNNLSVKNLTTCFIDERIKNQRIPSFYFSLNVSIQDLTNVFSTFPQMVFLIFLFQMFTNIWCESSCGRSKVNWKVEKVFKKKSSSAKAKAASDFDHISPDRNALLLFVGFQMSDSDKTT